MNTSAQEDSAYQLALSAKRLAYEQGKAGELMSGDAGLCSRVCDRGMGVEDRGITGIVGVYPNAFKDAHQRGIDGLPFELIE